MDTTEAVQAAAAASATAWSELADLIERHPDLGIDPALLTPGQDLILIYCPTPEEYAATVRRVIDGAPLGTVEKTGDETWQKVTRTLGGWLRLQVYVTRTAVCERRQTGTRVERVPDPEALKAVPMVDLEVPVWEWECSPILAPSPEAVA